MADHDDSKHGEVQRQFYSLQQAAVYSGLSPSTLRRATKQGKLTGHRPTPNKILIDRADLDRFVRGG